MAFERWSAVLGGCALVGAFYYYTLFAVTARVPSGALESAIRDVVDGRSLAPSQYRFLVPSVLVWLSDHASLSLAQATILVDGVALIVGVSVGLAVLHRVGLGIYALPVLMYCTFLAIGLFLYPRPETTTAFASVTAALLALGRRPLAEGWWRPTVVWSALLVASVVLIGCRTDLLLAVGIAFGVRWWQRRERVDATLAVALGGTAALASVVLVRHYPDARYRSGVDVVQLWHNLDALPIVVAALFLLPALGPLFVLVRHAGPRAELRTVAVEHLPLLAMIATEVAATFIVGRIEEIRLFFPVAFALAWVGTDLWRVLVASVENDEAP